MKIQTKSENTVKAYEFLKKNPTEMFTLARIAEALGVETNKILGGVNSLEKKGILAKHEVEEDGKARKAYSVVEMDVEFEFETPATMSDKAVRVLQYLQAGGEGQTNKEIADALGVAAIGVSSIIASLVKKNLAVREEIQVEVGEEVKTVGITRLTEEGKNYVF